MTKLVIGNNKQIVTPAIVKNKLYVPTYVPNKVITKTGELSIDTNQTTYSSAPATSVGTYGLSYAFRASNLTSVDLSSLTKLNNTFCLGYAFAFNKSLTSVNFNSLTEIDGIDTCVHAFENCTALTAVEFPALKTIKVNTSCGGMFYNCTNLETISFPVLERISGREVCTTMFYGCNKLKTVNFPALHTIGSPGAGNNPLNYMFQSCTGLTTVNFPILSTIAINLSASYGQVFKGCTKLETVNFGGLTSTTFSELLTQLQYLFDGNTGKNATNGCTIHFPSNFDPSDPDHTFDASTLSGYPTFGGNASYIHIAFDLPATE